MVALALIFRVADPGRAAALLRAQPAWVWTVPALLMLANAGLHALRIALLVDGLAPGAVLRAVLVGNFLGLVLPTGGGEAAKALLLARAPRSVPGAAPVGLGLAVAAIAASRLLELGSWGLLCAWAALGVLPGAWPGLVPLAAAASGAMFVVFGLGLALLTRGRSAGRLSRLGLGRRLAGFRPAPARLAASWLCTLPFAAINCAAAWFALARLGLELPYPTVLGLVPTLDLLIALPLSISGVGVRESAFQLAFRHAPEAALAAAWLRWSGELVRAAVGGLLFVAGPGPGRRTSVTESA